MLYSTLQQAQSPASIAATVVLLPLLYFVYVRLVRQPTIFDKLPWAGLEKGRFGRLKTWINIRSRREALYQAFRDYSAQGKPFIWQQFMGRPMVVLPPENLRWVIDQPHENIDSHAFFNDQLALETSLMDPQINGEALHIKVVQQNLNRALGWTPNYILDELSRCFDDYWGFSTEWHEEVVWNSIIRFVARTVNRMFVGEELCRNEDFIDAAIEYAQIFVIQGIKLRPFPVWFRRLISYPMTLPQRRVLDRVNKHVGPIIERRKADYERKLADPSFAYTEPNDALQWLIQHSYAHPNTTNRDSLRILRRFMSLNFAAIHTTTTNSTYLILDLAATKESDGYLSRIREQIVDVYRECGGEWTKAHLVKLDLLDSALRETLRINSAGGAWTPARKVLRKGGVTLPDGLHVPEGAHIAIPSYGLHHPDESWFEYQPFRWSGMRADKGKGLDEMLEERNLQATATGLRYLPFGHGRDACPGRFFAVQEIKLMMVHFLLNYEVKHLPERVPGRWFADNAMAPTDAKVQIRRISPPSLD